jgi:predicted enzyme related to lactoylglutathione lyase
MERVRGIGGVFFKANDPKALAAWYARHLGVPVEAYGGASFRWRECEQPGSEGMTSWSPLPADTSYFAPSKASFMINFRVENLERMLVQLRDAGVEVDAKIDDSEYGRFGWCIDPEGNRVELWEPPRS